MTVLELPDDLSGMAKLKVDGRLDAIFFFDKCDIEIFETLSFHGWMVALSFRDELVAHLWPDAIRRG